MGFIEDHVIPRLALEHTLIPSGDRIRRNADVESVLVHPALTEILSFFSIAVVTEDLEARQELLELHLPIK